MKIKKCQIDMNKPCADKGYVCLKSEKEKREFNAKISKMQDKLEELKFADVKEINN